MNHKVGELDGQLLNAAVARCEGYELDSDGDNLTIRTAGGAPSTFNPVERWAHGGEIIEREGIVVVPERGGISVAFLSKNYVVETGKAVFEPVDVWVGPTPLTAAMRAYVGSKFGDEVEL